MDDAADAAEVDAFVNATTIPYPRAATAFAAACAVLFAVVGVVGNAVTVVALLRCSKLRQHATTAFVVSLCASDLLFCSVNLPLTAARYIHEAWLLGPTLCRLFPFFFYGNVAVSLLSMVAITLNRYVLVACRGLYDRLYRPRHTALMLALAWLFSFCLMVPPLAGVWGQLGLHPPTFSCTILKKAGRSPKKALFIIGFLLPCIVIIISYSCIYWKVRRSRRALQAYRSSTVPSGKEGPGGTAGAGPPPSTAHLLQRRDDIRLTRLMLTIFCCFLLCFLPLMLVNVADDEMRYPILHVLASVLAWASAVVNPFIYAGSNRQYRAAYRRLLCGSRQGGSGGGAGGGSRRAARSGTRARQPGSSAGRGAAAAAVTATATNSLSRSVSTSPSASGGSGRTFVTEALQYSAAAERVQMVNAAAAAAAAAQGTQAA